jgi:hypothetical protein
VILSLDGVYHYRVVINFMRDGVKPWTIPHTDDHPRGVSSAARATVHLPVILSLDGVYHYRVVINSMRDGVKPWTIPHTDDHPRGVSSAARVFTLIGSDQLHEGHGVHLIGSDQLRRGTMYFS